MAEGVTSIKDGSDADFEFVCTPCGEDDIREEAVKFCAECNQYLCNTCVRYHRRIAASKYHKLLDREDAKNASTVAMTTKCRYHQDRDIEMFCGAHDMVYCTKCIATEHRTCENVKSIDDITTSIVQQNEIQRLQDEIGDVHDQLVAVQKKKQTNVGSIEQQRTDILLNMEDVERDMVQHIGKLKSEAIESLNKTYSTANNELETEIGSVTYTITEVDKSTHMLQRVSGIEARQQFVEMKLIQRVVKDAKTLFEESESKGTRVVGFTENADLRSGIMTATEFGRVETLRENQKQPSPRQYKMKAKKEINVRMQNDSDTCYITGVCSLHGGTVVMVDYCNKKLKRLDMNFNIKDHCDLNASPWSICCTAKEEVAVKLNNNNVQFISIGRSLSILREISIHGEHCWGIAYCAGELWVSTVNSVNVYSTSGTLQKSINKNVNGQIIFKASPQNMALSGDTVIIADNSDGAVCLVKDGTVRSELRDSRLKNARGVCVSSGGTVFLSAYSSRNIVMFGGDGKCLGELLTAKKGITCPLSLCYVNERNCLIVTRQAYCDNIHILEMCD